MKSKLVLAFSITAWISSTLAQAAPCGIWAVPECASHDRHKYHIFNGEDAVENFCYTWEQAVQGIQALQSRNICQTSHRCEIKPWSRCTTHDTAKLSVIVGNYRFDNYCYTFDIALSTIDKLRAAGVCP